MQIRIVAVGQLKERCFLQAQEEYLKRLRRYARLSVLEVADEPVPRGEREQLAVMRREGERLLSKVAPGSVLVALAVQGKELDSESLAAWLEEQMGSGRSALSFVIGGTMGLSEEVLQRAELLLSLSRLTFPHQLARVMLLEQLYRSFRIMRGEPYHH